MSDPLNRSNAIAIIKFFDVCFRQGVIDACDANDDYSVREFLGRHQSEWTFGFLREPEVLDWRTYRFVLYRWAREARLPSFAESYILSIRKTTHLWCLLPFCMRFYLMGVQEWLDYPTGTKMNVFRVNKRAHWNPNLPVKKFTRMDYISYMHEAAFAYRKLDEEKRLVPVGTMDSYIQALYDLTRKA